MPPPSSMDLRTRVLADCDRGMRTGAVAEKYTVSPAWVRRLKQRRRQVGDARPREGTPGPKPALAEGAPDGDRLAALARAEPDLSAREYQRRLGLGCHPTTVWRALRRLGLTFKKSDPRLGAVAPRRGRPQGAVAERGHAGAGPGQAGVPG